MKHHAGFNVFFRPGHPTMFGQRVGKGNPLTLNLFEEVGIDGPANEAWHRLFPDIGLACAELRVVTFIQPMDGCGVAPYMDEFRDCEIISERKPGPEYTGALPIASIVSVSYGEKVAKDFLDGARKVP